MFIVNKKAPEKVIEGVKGSSIMRVLRHKEMTSKSKEHHIMNFLEKLHKNNQWMICDCQPDLHISESPALSVVKRAGVLFLRNLPSRKSHKDNCPFKYVRSTPWVEDLHEFETNNEVLSVSEYTLNNPSKILSDLILQSEWYSYDQDYSFLSMISKVSDLSTAIKIDGSLLSDGINQSPKLVFTSEASLPQISLVVVHNIDWATQSLIRVEKDVKKSVAINGGIIPVRPVQGDEPIKGPYLALITSSVVAEEVVTYCSYVPISENKVQMPILSEGERLFSRLITRYSDWLFKAESLKISLSKEPDKESLLSYGFMIASDERKGRVVIDSSLEEVRVEEDTLEIPEKWLADIMVNQAKANKIKSAIRELII